MADLFGDFDEATRREAHVDRKNFEVPLAERMRPQTLDEYAGQEHIIGPGKPLRALIEAGRLPSCVLYGNPGIGKTTLVRVMAAATKRELLEINAVSAKVSQIRDLLEEATGFRAASGRNAVAFVDEIYHLNSGQQNVLLPAVERGDIILVGTTSENPWFEINKTLLSRMIVYTLKPLEAADVARLLRRAIDDNERGLGKFSVSADDDVLLHIASLTSGDARQALTRLEAAATSVALGGGSVLTREAVDEATGRGTLRYDRASADHYSVISALIKSVRGSDPDAALYWLARMLASGDDVRFICRRLCILAAEDVGLADPIALILAESCASACDRVGLPEAKLIMAETVVYLASAPKSNSAYMAIDAAEKAVSAGDIMEVPYHLRNDGEGYVYPHDDPRHWVPQKYLPKPARFYYPGGLGAETRMAERLKRFWKRFSDGE
ncbi:MAG: replication-associated recombination protein A [Synergistaceae bacterium]|jgi:putative ATPase|nr:replication-associated recombination protein A [Synergistaceae bacterium]